MNLHLFGAATPVGEALRQQLCSDNSSFRLFAYSRRCPSLLSADFNAPELFTPAGDRNVSSLWISFAPIWLLSPFFEYLAQEYPERLVGLRGVIACSSSSVITKRFAANCFDRDLVSRLVRAENQLISTCRRLEVSCCILRPTLIYGRVGPYLDTNLSRLITLMRRLPLLPLPSHTGLRQPIHACQLSMVVLDLVHQFNNAGCETLQLSRIDLGGDSEISYSSMLKALQLSLPPNDPASRCRFLFIPNRLFQLAAAPLLFSSPRFFEAVSRMCSDLSGFTPAHQLLKAQPQAFPVQPFL